MLTSGPYESCFNSPVAVVTQHLARFLNLEGELDFVEAHSATFVLHFDLDSFSGKIFETAVAAATASLTGSACI